MAMTLEYSRRVRYGLLIAAVVVVLAAASPVNAGPPRAGSIR